MYAPYGQQIPHTYNPGHTRQPGQRSGPGAAWCRVFVWGILQVDTENRVYYVRPGLKNSLNVFVFILTTLDEHSILFVDPAPTPNEQTNENQEIRTFQTAKPTFLFANKLDF
jgi:hypothetical protein